MYNTVIVVYQLFNVGYIFRLVFTCHSCTGRYCWGTY